MFLSPAAVTKKAPSVAALRAQHGKGKTMRETISYSIAPPSVNWFDVAVALQLELLLTLFVILFGLCALVRELCNRME